MSTILTPVSLWSKFDSSLDVEPEVAASVETNGIRFDRVYLSGRAVGNGRVKIAAVFACDAQTPATETVLIFPDSCDTIDEGLLTLFVKRGYSAMMVDYRGDWKGCKFHTKYPSHISYANTTKCGRYKDFVDESADKTCWYEWVAIGIFARKYIVQRTGSDKIAVLGIRDGGEVAWKLGVADKFSCIIPVCAAGWKAYSGISKYSQDEPELNEERYRFIAGVDSQAYAPYVNCPVLMLCTTNDPQFDYDRAYDTLSRVNPEYSDDSVIAYSVKTNACIGVESLEDVFLFLLNHLKNRQVFTPKPAEITVIADEEENLVARVGFDGHGKVESCTTYLAEDFQNAATREWFECPLKNKISETEQEFYLNVFEKTTSVMVLSEVKYSNGFTVFSKMTVKKIGGIFRNMRCKSRVLYSNKSGADGFSVADVKTRAVGGIFVTEAALLPRIVTKAKGVKGLYSVCGLETYRFNHPQFAPQSGNALSIDVFCDKTAEVTLAFTDLASGEVYTAVLSVIGGVWQSFISECDAFKNASGAVLPSFTGEMKLTIKCPVQYAINNVMWL